MDRKALRRAGRTLHTMIRSISRRASPEIVAVRACTTTTCRRCSALSNALIDFLNGAIVRDRPRTRCLTARCAVSLASQAAELVERRCRLAQACPAARPCRSKTPKEKVPRFRSAAAADPLAGRCTCAVHVLARCGHRRAASSRMRAYGRRAGHDNQPRHLGIIQAGCAPGHPLPQRQRSTLAVAKAPGEPEVIGRGAECCVTHSLRRLPACQRTLQHFKPTRHTGALAHSSNGENSCMFPASMSTSARYREGRPTVGICAHNTASCIAAPLTAIGT